jgi:hypothetical protein
MYAQYPTDIKNAIPKTIIGFAKGKNVLIVRRENNIAMEVAMDSTA